jgi:hypothetical protein
MRANKQRSKQLTKHFQITSTKELPQMGWKLCGETSGFHQSGQMHFEKETVDFLLNKELLCSTVCYFLCFP